MRLPYFRFHRSAFTILLVILVCSGTRFTEATIIPPAPIPDDTTSADLYTQLELATIGLQRQPFEKAMEGLRKLSENGRIARDNLLTIADLSKSSNEKRLYIIDLAKKMVLFHTYVSHGRNTGHEYARHFGNEHGSYKSSLGFFETGNIYQGAHGTSLRLKGIESGINDRALERGIVIHGAGYVSEDFIKRHGRLGRSHGCPAVPQEQCADIVKCISGGSCLYIYYPDSSYFRRSPVFSGN